jgi:prepilin-type N-terminal cleavage/methylation domain-containing protein
MNTLHPHRFGRGFTLIETIVSVTILAVAVVGPLTLSAQSVRASRDARLEIEATYLATEGIELMHNMRDNSSADDASAARTDWLKVAGVETMLTKCLYGCTIDITSNNGAAGGLQGSAVSACTGGTSCASAGGLLRNQDSGLYRTRGGAAVPNGWGNSEFARVLTVTSVALGSNVRIVSTVTYLDSHGVTKSIVASDDLYNWFPKLN